MIAYTQYLELRGHQDRQKIIAKSATSHRKINDMNLPVRMCVMMNVPVRHNE